MFYQAIVIPFQISFIDSSQESKLDALETMFDIFFIVDICKFEFLIDVVISFNCGFYKKGNLIMNRKTIITNYLLSWFLLDLVASLPYTAMVNTQNL